MGPITISDGNIQHKVLTVSTHQNNFYHTVQHTEASTLRIIRDVMSEFKYMAVHQ
jgi:hypothetical protein